MKKFALFISTLAFLTATAASQDVIENPAKPTSGNSGRIITLKEEMRINDTGESFFFKSPRTIRVSHKGDIFIQDGQEQVLQFDPQGRFIRNVYKKGQGPGELSHLLDIWVSRDRLFLAGYPPKILVYDYDGNVNKEIPLRDTPSLDEFIMADAGSILINQRGRPDLSKGTGLWDIPQVFIEINPDGEASKKIGSFPIRGYIQVFPSGATSQTTWNQLQTVPLDEKIIVLNSTPEYLVETFDREKGTVIRRFNRPYSRVKRTGGGGVSGPGEGGPPPPEFYPDIIALHVADGKIWVQTSTYIADKGILFDVFSPEGRYLDSFFIQVIKKNPAGNPALKRLTIADDFVYFTDKTEDELLVVKKCRLVGL